jgi:hypothetical protein
MVPLGVRRLQEDHDLWLSAAQQIREEKLMQPINRVKSGVSGRWAAIGISKSRFAAAALTAFVAAGASAAVSQPAFARDLGTAPACIFRGKPQPTSVRLTNGCSRLERVAVEVNVPWGPDHATSCISIPVGQSQNVNWLGGRYKRTFICG